jgi:sugar O-acyltransferase (sialic acid O-acetyltransferase NeuD family)
VRPVVIFGIGELAELARFYFAHDTDRRVAAHTVDGAYVTASSFGEVPVVPFEEVADVFSPAEHDFFVALGYTDLNQARATKIAAARAKGYPLATYVSSRTVTWPGLVIGDNCFVMEGNVIQPFATLGAGVIVWSGNLISHHVAVGDHCFIASHVVIGGGTRIGAGSFIGMNATIREHVTIGPGAIVGAGAVILKDVAEGAAHLIESTPPSRLPAARLKRLLTP